LHEHGDYGDPTVERAGDLEPDEVAGVVEPASSLLVGDPDPRPPDHRDQDAGRADRLLDPIDEVDTRLERVHVHEDPLRAEARAQPVVQAPGVPGGVLTPVADEDSWPCRQSETSLPRR
jgi:hypothetical protein